jgi:hypothetical protein
MFFFFFLNWVGLKLLPLSFKLLLNGVILSMFIDELNRGMRKIEFYRINGRYPPQGKPQPINLLAHSTIEADHKFLNWFHLNINLELNPSA